jgi:hypothetical protein
MLMAHPRNLFAPVLALVIAGLAPPAGAQGRWIDLGSPTSTTIFAAGDPSTFERFPPYAFGSYQPGSYSIYAELLGRPCNTLPSTAICQSGRFVSAFDAFIHVPDSCPCSGVLMRPLEIEIHYDPSRVPGRETDLRLTLYDNARGEWVELPDQRVVPERDVVTATHLGYARQYFALLLAPPSAGGPATWGRIKALWSR